MSKKTIVTQDLSDERIEAWLRSETGQKIGIRGGSSELDVATFEKSKQRTLANRQVVLRRKAFNAQQSWLKSGKPLSEWKGEEPFHLLNPIITATWLAGKNGSTEVVFADVLAEKEVEKDFESNLFRSVMKKLQNEFGLKYKYSNLNSQLFRDIGAESFDPNFGKAKPAPLSFSPIDVFGPQKGPSGSGAKVEDSSKTGALAHFENKTLVATASVPENPARIEKRDGIILLEPEDPGLIKDAVARHGASEELYLVSSAAERKIKEIRPEPLPDPVKTATALSLGGYEVKKTDGRPTQKPMKTFLDRLNRVTYV